MNEYERWFVQAQEDFDTACFNIKGKKWKAGVFFLQQAVEKALKSLVIKKFRKLTKTHDLLLLAREVAVPQNIADSCAKLNPAYGYTRYPDVEGLETSRIL